MGEQTHQTEKRSNQYSACTRPTKKSKISRMWTVKKATLVCSLVQKLSKCWLQFILKVHTNYMTWKNTVVVGIKMLKWNLTCMGFLTYHECHIIWWITATQVKLYKWQWHLVLKHEKLGYAWRSKSPLSNVLYKSSKPQQTFKNLGAISKL
jgi:hypothetical protein